MVTMETQHTIRSIQALTVVQQIQQSVHGGIVTTQLKTKIGSSMQSIQIPVHWALLSILYPENISNSFPGQTPSFRSTFLRPTANCNIGNFHRYLHLVSAKKLIHTTIFYQKISPPISVQISDPNRASVNNSINDPNLNSVLHRSFQHVVRYRSLRQRILLCLTHHFP